MNRRHWYRLASGCLAAAITAGVLSLSTTVACAAEPLPVGGRQTLALVSAVSTPQPGVAAGPRWSPADPCLVPAVDCASACPGDCEATWQALGPLADFQQWAQGEYVGRSRLPHVPVYRLRVDDAIDFEFRVDHNGIAGSYRFSVGDELVVDSATVPDLQRRLGVLPDGTVTLPLVGQVETAGRTVTELRDALQEKYKKYYEDPAISVNPTKINTPLEELRYAVAGLSGFSKQIFAGRVTPEGTIQLPAVGSVPAQGLTLDEFKTELDERFAEKIDGMEVIPALRQHGPRYVYVLGEVATPGRYTLEAPTTVMQAISMAGSWTVGAHITNVVVFRRADDWHLIATMLDLRAALLGKTPCPEGEIWVSDADLIIVPKSRILRTDNFIELVFTRGIYGVIPIRGNLGYSAFKGVFPIPVIQ